MVFPVWCKGLYTDLNPSQHLWDELQCQLRARPYRPTSVLVLTGAIVAEWKQIPVANSCAKSSHKSGGCFQLQIHAHGFRMACSEIGVTYGCNILESTYFWPCSVVRLLDGIPRSTCEDVDRRPGQRQARQWGHTFPSHCTTCYSKHVRSINGERQREREREWVGGEHGQKREQKEKEENITFTTDSNFFSSSWCLLSSVGIYSPGLGESLSFSCLIHVCVLVSVSNNTAVTTANKSLQSLLPLLKQKLEFFFFLTIDRSSFSAICCCTFLKTYKVLSCGHLTAVICLTLNLSICAT